MKIRNAILAIVFSLTVLGMLSFAIAKPNLVPATNNKGGVVVIIPEHAVQVADNVFGLGTASDVDGKVVEGFLFVDNKKANAKPGTVCGNNVCEPGENAKKCPADCGGSSDPGGDSTCFTLMAKGARWRTTEPYVTDVGVDLALTEESLEVWDSEVGFEIFGLGSSGVTDGADDVAPDGVNEIAFENLGPTNTIAFTIVWGIFRGPPSGRELVEWDVVFNTAYPFGDADVNASFMDFKNIAVHEYGHALGLSHPADTCTEESMFAFASTGETKKRDLHAGDIAGENKIYG